MRELADGLAEAEISVYRPPGGHAVYVDAGAFFPDIPPAEFPGQALVCELYREGGIRGIELGSLVFPDADRPELTRLAVPRRIYHRGHRQHVIETFEAVSERREAVAGYRIDGEPSMPVELPALFVRFIGVAEVLGAIGLLLPGLLNIREELTLLAAAGIVIIMSGATVLTLVSGDVGPALVPVIVGFLAVFVAYGRWRLRPFTANTL